MAVDLWSADRANRGLCYLGNEGCNSVFSIRPSPTAQQLFHASGPLINIELLAAPANPVLGDREGRRPTPRQPECSLTWKEVSELQAPWNAATHALKSGSSTRYFREDSLITHVFNIQSFAPPLNSRDSEWPRSRCQGRNMDAWADKRIQDDTIWCIIVGLSLYLWSRLAE